jgi:hypothetical protein
MEVSSPGVRKVVLRRVNGPGDQEVPSQRGMTRVIRPPRAAISTAGMGLAGLIVDYCTGSTLFAG